MRNYADAEQMHFTCKLKNVEMFTADLIVRANRHHRQTRARQIRKDVPLKKKSGIDNNFPSTPFAL